LGLLRAEPSLSAGRIGEFFKDAGFGPGPHGIASTATPRAGVRIVRDREFSVPHVYGKTRKDVMFGSGYVQAEDRLFVMDVLRHVARARLSELVGPDAIEADARQIREDIVYTEAELRRQLDELPSRYGREGARLRADLAAYGQGVNRYIAEARLNPLKLPVEYPALGTRPRAWRDTDTAAVTAYLVRSFGEFGGNEDYLDRLRSKAEARFGEDEGRAVFEDLRRRDDDESPTVTRNRFPYPDPRGRVDARAVARLDHDSVERRDPVLDRRQGLAALRLPAWARRLARRGVRMPPLKSNALMVTAKRSDGRRPVAVIGPQLGYSSPPIVMEVDLHGPGVDVRGMTFPGNGPYAIIGRGPDYAWSGTVAQSDTSDVFVERLCEPSGKPPSRESRHYLYRGRCVPFTVRDYRVATPVAPSAPAVPEAATLRDLRSVHGVVVGTATVRGAPVAVVRSLAMAGVETGSLIWFKRMNENIAGADAFMEATRFFNAAVNWFYVDGRDIAWHSSGWFPLRAAGTDPDLPTWGTGRWDWRGFDPSSFAFDRLAHERVPNAKNPPSGYIVDWNNRLAPGWRAHDGTLAFGPVWRGERLRKPVAAALERGPIDLVQLTRIMQQGATANVAGRELLPVLLRVIGERVPEDLADAVALLREWHATGAHRRDLDGDNALDDGPAVLLMDALFERFVPAVFESQLGGDLYRELSEEWDRPHAFDTAGIWMGYLHKDLRTLLGDRVVEPFSRRYCGGGDLGACRDQLLKALRAAAEEVRAAHGSLEAARKPATCTEGFPECDQNQVDTLGAVSLDPFPWQDRPTFQQIVQFPAPSK